MEGVSITELAESLRVTTDHIRRCATFLLGKGLVREEEDRYHLSTELEQFFNWYKDSFSLQMSPSPISGATLRESKED
jgi:DNA-binding IclR family transcriptional regulator